MNDNCPLNHGEYEGTECPSCADGVPDLNFDTTYVYLDQYPNVRVEWEWIGEGYDGDYDPEDPDDEPLLRFSVEIRAQHPTEGDVGDWEQAEDASYCTRNPIGTSQEDLRDIGESIIIEYVNASSPKKAMEAASWFVPRAKKEQL